MKHTKIIYKLFKYFESKEITFKFLLESLKKIGWLQEKSSYKKNDKNLMRISSKTLHSDITEFIKNELLEIKIKMNGIGEQTIGFKITEKKNKSVLEMAMKIIFSDNFSEKDKKLNYSKLKNGFNLNCKNIDNLIRDDFESNGLKSYY